MELHGTNVGDVLGGITIGAVSNGWCNQEFSDITFTPGYKIADNPSDPSTGMQWRYSVILLILQDSPGNGESTAGGWGLALNDS
eukprot:scaffold22560_cov135-Cylindrotheca_fusiformis.AAC.25